MNFKANYQFYVPINIFDITSVNNWINKKTYWLMDIVLLFKFWNFTQNDRYRKNIMIKDKTLTSSSFAVSPTSVEMSTSKIDIYTISLTIIIKNYFQNTDFFKTKNEQINCISLLVKYHCFKKRYVLKRFFMKVNCG